MPRFPSREIFTGTKAEFTALCDEIAVEIIMWASRPRIASPVPAPVIDPSVPGYTQTMRTRGRRATWAEGL
jgi:hypothetical protein